MSEREELIAVGAKSLEHCPEVECNTALMSDGEKKSRTLPRGPNVSTRRGRVRRLNITNREFSWGGRVTRTLARLLIRVLQCSQASREVTVIRGQYREIMYWADV